MQQFDVLQNFLQWWMNNKVQNPPSGELIRYDTRLTEVLKYRQGPFQVQECITAPNTEVPDHIHPDVDSYEVYMGGDITFRVDGVHYEAPYESVGVGHVRVLPNSFHGASVGPRGGLFLSVQHWINPDKPPTFISSSWEFANKEFKADEKSQCS